MNSLPKKDGQIKIETLVFVWSTLKFNSKLDINTSSGMKDQTQKEFNPTNQQLPQIQWKSLDRKNSFLPQPKARFKHQSFIYKQTLYVHGGASLSPTNPPDQALDIHFITLDRHHLKWQTRKMKCNHKDVELVSGHCSTLIGNKWYTFGGINSDFKCNSKLWVLNIENLQLAKLQQTGVLPCARQSASLFSLNSQWLILYGGINTSTVQIFNSFHFFNLQQRIWLKCQPINYSQIYPRYDPALTASNGIIYLFGGLYRNSDNQQVYLNDFYSIDISTSNHLTCPDLTVKRLRPQLLPQARTGHSLIGVGDNHLLLVGGQSCIDGFSEGKRNDSILLLNNCWVYHIDSNLWNPINISNNSDLVLPSQFSIAKGQNNKLHLFGGIKNYSTIFDHLFQLTVPISQLHHFKKQKIKCTNCKLIQKYPYKPSVIPAYLIQDIACNIQFPFAAIGLLMDNSLHHLATFTNIYLQDKIGNYQGRVLKITDNAKLPWTQEEFISTMNNFCTESVLPPAATDKKVKALMFRDRYRREYGTNIKIASLRLGAGFLHVSQSENGQLVRVCLFRKQTKGIQRYVLNYFIYQRQSNQVLSPDMAAIRTNIELQFESLLKNSLSKQQIKNALFILEPRVQNFNDSQQTYELKFHQGYNDILCGQNSSFILLQQKSYNITECVDVSLRAYLVSLYLKNQHTKISLSIRNINLALISTQVFLERVDRLCRQKHVMQLNQIIEFDFKIVQLYYLYDKKKRLNYFSNGILIYHRNRLITRYKYKLGELIRRKIYNAEGNHNFISLFGFIELPDSIPINAFKTDVIFNIMVQKLYARIKVVNKMFKKEFQRLAVESIKRSAPKLTEEQIRQDQADNPEFIPVSDRPKQTQQKQKNGSLESRDLRQQVFQIKRSQH